MALFWILLIVATYLGFEAKQQFVSCLFVVVLVYSIFQSFPYRHVVWSELDNSLGDILENEIELEFDEHGVTVILSDIRSVVPWNALGRYQQIEKHLCIEFGPGFGLVIPKRELGEGQSLDEIAALLKQHKV